MEKLDEESLDKLEKRIEDLRVQFEQYFLGSRRTAPENERTSVQYAIRRMSNILTPNYAIKFRYQQLVAKFNAYNQYWTRIQNQIEMGTYSRDKFKAILHSEQEALEKKLKKEKKAEKEESLSPDVVDRLYQELLQARSQCNQPANLSKEKLEETLKKQYKELKEKYKDKKIEFKVVVEQGKAKLKATTKG